VVRFISTMVKHELSTYSGPIPIPQGPSD